MAKPRLLIVEDDPDVSEMLQMYFGTHGYEASLAEDGETAIKFCRANLPNRVLLDINLPDVGLLLAELLNDLGRHNDFLGQFGDGTFVIISPLAHKPDIIQQAKTRFRLAIPSFYSFGETQNNGNILTMTASGAQHSLPCWA